MKNTLLNCSIAQLFKRKPASPNRGEQCNNGTMQQSNQGFTLIELLVAIAIIGILATMLIPNYIEARVRARDAQRKNDLRSIQAALEAYRNDHGAYPAVVQCCQNATTALSALAPAYLKELPRDPLYNASDQYAYYNYDDGKNITGGGNCSWVNGNQEYRLYAWLENIQDLQGTGKCGEKNVAGYIENGHLMYAVVAP